MAHRAIGAAGYDIGAVKPAVLSQRMNRGTTVTALPREIRQALERLRVAEAAFRLAQWQAVQAQLEVQAARAAWIRLELLLKRAGEEAIAAVRSAEKRPRDEAGL